MTMTNHNDVVLDGRLPFIQRIAQLVEVWVRDGRGRDHVVTDKAFFTVYSWYLRHRDEHDPVLGEFVAVSHDFNGGDDGWETMLRVRAVCAGCWDTYRMGNIYVCTGCMEYGCDACGPHRYCAGELV
ncbi:hypothetical protein ACWGR4_31660 [Embleya sp. NPDC055664]|uniref:hypothetical protein n=1 Tax=Embleya sp. NPDC059237 TaxID=3346784 RepID=UPI00369453E9